ncbi:MAG: glycosyl hydrolase family 18 protein [Gemmatimonadota bacterium]
MHARTRLPAFALFVAILALSAAPATAQRMERLFYYVDSEDSYASLQQHIDQISVVAPVAYKVDQDGVVWGEVDPRVIRLAGQHDVPVMPLIANLNFNQEWLHQLLTNDAARQRVIRTLLELCRRNGFWGIQFDFEDLSINDRDAYSRFVKETAEALHAEKFKLSIAVVHRPDQLPGPTAYQAWLFEDWRAGYDVDALGKSADFISVMTYSQHTRRTPPGPNAGLPWVRDVVQYFLDHMPADKLSLGVPTVSQHWYTSYEPDRIQPEKARSYSEVISYKRAQALIDRNNAEVVWSEQQEVPYTFYSRGGTFEWIFLEDARSFAAKLGLVDDFHLRGISVWHLGVEDPGIWKDLEERR